MHDGSPDDLEFDAFASSLDDMLERVSSSTRAEQAARDSESPAPAMPASRPSSAPATAAQPAPATPAPSAPTPGSKPPRASAAPPASARSSGVRKLAWGAVALAALGVVGAWTGLRVPAPRAPAVSFDNLPAPAAGPGRPAPSPPTRVAAASPSTIGAEASAMPVIAIDPDASTEAIMLGQLRRDGTTDATTTAPDFAIARYDALPPASRGWEVLVPLSVEEVYALVPATSHLRDLDDLRGRRINVGASGSPRARSGEALYRTLFDQALPPAPLRAASKDAALSALLRGDGLDAILLFDGQPSSWLAGLPVETRLQLKVLRFDPTAASGKRALRAYLSTRVVPKLVPELAAVPTLGEVTFLVALRGQASSPELVRRLCERLPAMRAGGHPKWREVDPALQLPVRLPRSPDIASAMQACAASPGSSTPLPGALS